MATRFQRQTLYAERGGVVTHEGLDPLTGLPVLMYSFRGAAPRALETLESENIPGLLELDQNPDQNGGTTSVVVAYSRDYRPLSRPEEVSPSVLLLDSARALRDAERAGVLHGDLRPLRFLASRNHVLVEGFGIPWETEPGPYRAPEAKPGFAADLYAWGKVMRELLGDSLSPAVLEVVERCLAEDPSERPDAAALYRDLETTLAESELRFAHPAPREPAERPRGGPDLEFRILSPLLEAESGTDPRAKPAPETPQSSSRDPLQGWGRDAWDDPELLPQARAADAAGSGQAAGPGKPPKPGAPRPLTAKPTASSAAGSGSNSDAKPASGAARFVKKPPPGATYRAGEATPRGLEPAPNSFAEFTFEPDDARGKQRRRIILLALLFVAATAFALLAFWKQRNAELPAAPPAGGIFLVDVIIEPPGLPPVMVYVSSSPEGSAHPPGAALREFSSETPGQLVLDQSGVWRLQAIHEGRASETVTLEVPETRSVTFRISDAAP